MRAIADEAGAYLLADISHVGGLVAAKAYPSPVGHAHVITTTTHKTLCGPRGAVILTTDAALAQKIDRAVFPGEQGGPHVNVFAALALAFKLAQTEEFAELQQQIITNCIALTERLEKRGLRIPFGGTNTHLTNIDAKSVTGPDGTPLSGDMAARILDLAGIVANRNTIPGDRSALNPSGVRMGTPWITQRGFTEKETVALADIIADILFATTPYRMSSRTRLNQRAKVDFKALEEARLKVRELALNAGIDFEPPKHEYPHFYYLDDQPEGKGKQASFEIGGERALHLLNVALASDVEALKDGGSQATTLHTPEGAVAGALKRVGAQEYQLTVGSDKAGLASAWLRALSDGYVALDGDIRRKAPGPVVVRGGRAAERAAAKGEVDSGGKPYYIGMKEEKKGQALPEFVWKEKETKELKRTSLYETHKKLGAKMVPFAGWEMPVWYSSVSEEHKAVREAAGLFDVTHMGVYQAEGPEAAVFLDSVCANDIAGLAVGQAAYTHFFNPHANVIDDLYVYRWAPEKYLVVVNAANDDKDWAWLNAVLEGKVQVDRERPWARAFGRNAVLRNLRDPKAGKEMRADLALQGPASREILLALKGDDETKKRIRVLGRNEVTRVQLEEIDLIVAGTGYTGEKTAFEIFVHPEQAPKLWAALMKAGEPFGLKPCGLGARDSLRTEAGLPLYGNEMGGKLNLGVGEAGFRTFAKTYKPWFIGREALLKREAERGGELVRFRFGEKGTRMAHLGDPVVDRRGKVVGVVTSCAADRFGTLTGQAFIDQKYTEKGTPIYIFQSAPDEAGKAPAELKPGDKITVPTEAQVLSRFPKL
jgi:glycine hydroxymethyltransferase